MKVEEVEGVIQANWVSSDSCAYKIKVDSKEIANNIEAQNYIFNSADIIPCILHEIEVISVTSSGEEGGSATQSIDRGIINLYNLVLYKL